MTDKLYKSCVLEVLDGRKGGPWDVLISTGKLDREKDTIDPLGWQVEDYLKNPVVMWAHDYTGRTPAGGVPVGLTSALQLDQKGPIATFNFREPANDHDFVTVVRSAWEQEVLRGGSVGFAPVESEENEHGGRHFTKQDLLEWSIVSIPANQDALRRAYTLALKAAGMEALIEDPTIYRYIFDTSTGSAAWLPPEEKPFPNFHACRLRSPDDFQSDSFRRVKREHEGKTYYVIMGRLQGETTMTQQAFRYPKGTWTVAQARAHCNDHDGQDFEPASSGESAIEGNTVTTCCDDADIPIPKDADAEPDAEPPTDADIQPAAADTLEGDAAAVPELTPEEEEAIAEAIVEWLEQISETIGVEP